MSGLPDPLPMYPQPDGSYTVKVEFLPLLPDPIRDKHGVPLFSADQMRAYAKKSVEDAIDAMDAAVKNGELPIECEDAVDWLQNRLAAAIRSQAR